MLLIAFYFFTFALCSILYRKNESNYLCGSFFVNIFGYKYQYLKLTFKAIFWHFYENIKFNFFPKLTLSSEKSYTYLV